MVIKTNNLKETEILLKPENKNLENEIKSLFKEIEEIKKTPFHDVFVYIPKEFPKNYFYKLLKEIKIKEIKTNKDNFLIKI
jgi:hypothetical protein